eukprot:7868524-Pyramimonas_sp.AAC.1
MLEMLGSGTVVATPPGSLRSRVWPVAVSGCGEHESSHASVKRSQCARDSGHGGMGGAKRGSGRRRGGRRFTQRTLRCDC